MITPCNQPLKTNPFTTYRDPVTGRWTVVETIPSLSQPDSNCKARAECNNESKVEKISSATIPVSLAKKPISFSLSLVQYPDKKLAVNSTIHP